MASEKAREKDLLMMAKIMKIHGVKIHLSASAVSAEPNNIILTEDSCISHWHIEQLADQVREDMRKTK